MRVYFPISILYPFERPVFWWFRLVVEHWPCHRVTPRKVLCTTTHMGNFMSNGHKIRIKWQINYRKSSPWKFKFWLSNIMAKKESALVRAVVKSCFENSKRKQCFRTFLILIWKCFLTGKLEIYSMLHEPSDYLVYGMYLSMWSVRVTPEYSPMQRSSSPGKWYFHTVICNSDFTILLLS